MWYIKSIRPNGTDEVGRVAKPLDTAITGLIVGEMEYVRNDRHMT